LASAKPLPQLQQGAAGTPTSQVAVLPPQDT
jgi:hypothetical protein